MCFNLRISVLSLFALLSISMIGCGSAVIKTKVIEAAVKMINDDKAKILAMDPNTQDLTASRDGELDGVLLEFTFKANAKVDPGFKGDAAKAAIIKQMKDSAVKKIVEQGVHVRFVYKSSDGETIADTKIEQADLK